MGQGFVLAGRYRLEERLQADPRGSQWRAVDQTLERQVVVRVLDSAHPQAEEIVDAARRAALAEDPRLVRILDVGSQNVPGGHATYIVSEHVNGRTLAEAVTPSPLPAETARRIVGEAAQALARAGSRGLHHLRLDPSTVFITSDGSVKVAGTAVDASVAGIEPETSQAAERTDAVGLVSVLYCAITGRWPGAGASRLDAAPLVNGRPVPPGDLVAGVPNDLDTLCTVTLAGHDDGPQTPAELAEQLAPWARSAQLTDPRGLAIGGPDRPSPRPAPRPAQHPGPVSRPSARPAASAGAPARPAQPRPTVTRPAAAVATPPSSVPAGPVPGAASPAARHGRVPTDMPTAQPDVPAAAVRTEEHRPELRTDHSGAHPAAHSGAHLATSSPAEDLFRPAADNGVGYPGYDPRYDDTPFGVVGTAAGSAPWSGFGRADEGEEFLGPFMPPAPLTRPSEDQSRTVLFIVAAIVAVVLVVAVWSLRDFGSGSGSTVTVPTTTGTATGGASGGPSPSGSPSGSPSDSPSAEPTASAKPVIDAITVIDPADGTENDSQLPRILDGDPDTAWKSGRYNTALFGGLKKQLSLVVALDERATVTSVEVDSQGSDGIAELRVSDTGTYEDSQVVATGTITDGTLVLTPQTPIATKYVVVSFTRAPIIRGKGQVIVSDLKIR